MTSLTRRNALGLFACAALAASARAAAPLPGDSVYHLHPRLVDQDGRPFDWGSTRGEPVLASMFYTSCEMVCPLIFESIRRTVDAFDKPVRDRVRVVMVSFDPERDTVAVLKETAARHHCDGRWSLVRGSAADARRIAALLGIQYRRLPSGEFNHSSVISLLDAEGRIARRTSTVGDVDPALVAAAKSV
ncbi:MAG: SCO family protein [Burkholderiales bacterium]|nr:SCO family protein [Burkholderiales bacterium]